MTTSLPDTHTPGPWRVSEGDHEWVVVAPWSATVKPGESATFGDYRGAHIACLPWVGEDAVPTPAQAHVNAHLIAAAPDLLAAAEAASAEAAAYTEYNPDTDDAFVRIRDLLRAAIAKAKGGVA